MSRNLHGGTCVHDAIVVVLQLALQHGKDEIAQAGRAAAATRSITLDLKKERSVNHIIVLKFKRLQITVRRYNNKLLTFFIAGDRVAIQKANRTTDQTTERLAG